MGAEQGAGVMFFLVRVGFWLGIVLLLLPTGAEVGSPGSRDVAVSAVAAAGAAVADVRQSCARQPDTCAVGSQVAAAFGEKVQASARALVAYFAAQLSKDLQEQARQPASRAPSATSRRAVDAAGAFPGTWSQDTLTASDSRPRRSRQRSGRAAAVTKACAGAAR
jgi:hypothetical protein